MERLTYSPDEIREAFRYALEQAGRVASSHAGNWRTKYTQFVEAMTKNQEALKLLARLFEGHQTMRGSVWYKKAADRQAPPWPADRYERLALGWQLVALAVQTRNPDGFDAREKVDLPYVLVNSDLPGGGLSEKYEAFRVAYLEPFAQEVGRLGEAIERAFPAGATSIDLWDAAVAAFTAKDEPAAPVEEPKPAGDGKKKASKTTKRKKS